ncbi:hypothetical protein G5T42_02775 [Microbacterium sp. 4R-513]|uniref:hypothetical protein n=1 Tax=Microbacterium sp. 4R-513 TaxID=2567934 RepID=UPI0013E0EB8C|nr:hypothetical protein [Microbacterium sp. 4R-513]QIG38535.1 hypothetical protein G5T42_02775 [Microbacterium sp. 4R-513]
MTVLVIIAIVAVWALMAVAILFVFGRVVRRADEENEVTSMRREMRAAERAEPAALQEPPATDAGSVSKRLRS